MKITATIGRAVIGLEVDSMAYLSTTVEDINQTTIALTGDKYALIRYHSNAKATMTLIDGVMNLDACGIVNGEERAYKDSHVFYGVESKEFYFSCSDSEYQHHSSTLSVPMIEYVKLTCNIEQTSIDGDGNLTLKCKGNSFNGYFGAVANSITVKFRYKEVSESAYGEWRNMQTTTYSNGGYQATYQLENLEYQKNYSFQVVATDKLEEKTATRTISSMPLFHWGKDRFDFEIPVRFHKEIVLRNGNSNFGNVLKFGDGNYCYIAEETDDSLTIYASKSLNLNSATGVNINGSAAPVSGIWTPAFYTTSAIQYYTSQHGWYSKVGKTVTIGFHIKATCNSGYHTTDVSIIGLPFIPLYNSASGGMCSGAYISAGKNFQCFVAETTGFITTRVQDCNNTTNTNLSTSAGGCFYRNGGGEITVSGTITYLTSN